jgi:ketosteroid isomerase-like protein
VRLPSEEDGGVFLYIIKKEVNMPEEKIAGIMREFVQVMASGDVAKTMGYLVDDPVYITPYGPYQGKEAVKQLLTAMSKNMKDMKVTESGNGIICQGDKAFFEHTISGTYQRKKYEFLAMCAYEFSGDKIKTMRTVYDRLLAAQQLVKGWPAKPIVNMVVRQSEKSVK